VKLSGLCNSQLWTSISQHTLMRWSTDHTLHTSTTVFPFRPIPSYAMCYMLIQLSTKGLDP